VTASLLTFSLTGANLQPLDVEAYDIPTKGVTVDLAFSPAFVETTQTLPAALQPLFPYSVVLENTTGTDIIAFNATWSTLDAQGQPHAAVTRTPWHLATPDRLTVIPAHSRMLITPVGEIPNELANMKSLPQPMLDDIAAKTKSFGANSMQWTLDSIVFADGSKIGPDNSHTGRTVAAWMTAGWKLSNEVSNQDPANVATYLATARDTAFAAIQSGSGTAQAPSFRIFSLSNVSHSSNLQEAYLKLRSRFAEQWRKEATVSAEAVVANANTTAAQWTGLSNLINRLGNAELAATASTQRKGKELWAGLEVRPAVLRLGEKYRVRRASYLGEDPSGFVWYDSCNFYWSYGVTDLNDPNCDNTGYVQVGDYFTFTDVLCDQFDYCWQGYLWATSFQNSALVGGNRDYDEEKLTSEGIYGALCQYAYLNAAYSPFFAVVTVDYGYFSEVFGSNYY
jgi:hypothetical protein